MRSFYFKTVCLAGVMLSLMGCEGAEPLEVDGIRTARSGQTVYKGEKQNTIFGEGGLLGTGKKNEGEQGGGIGVNSFLWRATLDTVSFLPINNADAFGGVILTDWYAPAETPNERFKLNVYILGRALRADGVRVSVFKEGRTASGSWESMAVGTDVATDIENAILTKARQLRNDSIGQ